MSKDKVKVLYDAIECMLKCFHYLILNNKEQDLKDAIIRYIESTVNEINEVQE